MSRASISLKGRKHMSKNYRHEARILLMQMILQMEAQKDFSQKAADIFLEQNPVPKGQNGYYNSQYSMIKDNLDTIDTMINSASHEWKVDRMPKVDLSICRLAASEILYNDKIPYKVSINEAVDIAKEFGEEDSYKFINGILRTIHDESQKETMKGSNNG